MRPVSCNLNCASIDATDAVIGCSIAKLVCGVLLKHCFEIRRVCSVNFCLVLRFFSLTTQCFI